MNARHDQGTHPLGVCSPEFKGKPVDPIWFFFFHVLYLQLPFLPTHSLILDTPFEFCQEPLLKCCLNLYICKKNERRSFLSKETPVSWNVHPTFFAPHGSYTVIATGPTYWGFCNAPLSSEIFLAIPWFKDSHKILICINRKKSYLVKWFQKILNFIGFCLLVFVLGFLVCLFLTAGLLRAFVCFLCIQIIKKAIYTVVHVS